MTADTIAGLAVAAAAALAYLGIHIWAKASKPKAMPPDMSLPQRQPRHDLPAWTEDLTYVWAVFDDIVDRSLDDVDDVGRQILTNEGEHQ